ncbi:Tigger transposable element-derived protein 6 [Nosema granulosis]|uniref:Tigger transposable element-derived protein 6 n=1 Tax=Nosema granulosis TaxID=83296 RepID=A0A9P6KXT1_9MICR|nr:Tigger transposable element-derived protein 6 [Nosema granulosis]
MFLPANSTSVIQPLDPGTVHSFKSKFCSLLNNFLISNAITDNLEHSQIPKTIYMSYVLHSVQNAFGEITADFISNCWRKTGIFNNAEIKVYLYCEDGEVGRSSESSIKSI